MNLVLGLRVLGGNEWSLERSLTNLDKKFDFF